MQFLTQVFTRTCEFNRGRGNRTLKPKRQSMKPYSWAIRKCNWNWFFFLNFLNWNWFYHVYILLEYFAILRF